MSLINLINRLEIALQCIEAARTALETNEHDKGLNLPEDIHELKVLIDRASLCSYDLMDQYDTGIIEQKRRSTLRVIQ